MCAQTSNKHNNTHKLQKMNTTQINDECETICDLAKGVEGKTYRYSTKPPGDLYLALGYTCRAKSISSATDGYSSECNPHELKQKPPKRKTRSDNTCDLLQVVDLNVRVSYRPCMSIPTRVSRTRLAPYFGSALYRRPSEFNNQ